ncbi:hypothetical protein [Aequorivita echinoideorum]|nr:hypothetical protein [Aequorivita echinoideorum]
MKSLILLFILLITSQIFSQVGIGNTNPNPTAALDITSTTQGMLAPRMTTAQRNAITTPANSLLVYDTTAESFFYYDSTPAPGAWVRLNSGANQRNNYKLVKSVADLAPELAAGGGSKYLLQSNTLYEINGTITLAFPIDLNSAYISGLDASEDVLFKATGPIFQGTTGGSIRNVTLTGGGSAFAITGGTSLLVQNTVVANFANVGTISNIGLYFSNIVQFVNNANGITYNNIGNLLLNNQAWLDSNNGTFETFTGTFGLIEKVSGFTSLNGSDVAMDVSSNPTVGNGVILSRAFSGTTSAPSGFIRKYTTGTYPGYNFTNSWTVNCPGIPRESDEVATGNLYYDSSSVVNITDNNAFKLPVTTISVRNFRTSSSVSNRITYEGSKPRSINIFASISFTATGGSRYAFSIYKNGVLVPGTTAIYDVLQTNQRQTVSVIGTVDINPSQYVEIYVQKLTSGNEQFLTTSYNLILD